MNKVNKKLLFLIALALALAFILNGCIALTGVKITQKGVDAFCWATQNEVRNNLDWIFNKGRENKIYIQCADKK